MSTYKNYNKNTIIKVACILSIFFHSCSKEKHPSIKIITPINGQIYNALDIIEINADLRDSDALTSEYLLVTKVNSTNDTIINFEDHKFTGNQYTYHLNKSFVCEANTQYKIVVSGFGHSSLFSQIIFVKAN
jgi:hypothetical protein